MVRIAHDPETQLYFERRIKEGKTKAEVVRILKRYVARELCRYRAAQLGYPEGSAEAV
jgi:hypothetical protein